MKQDTKFAIKDINFLVKLVDAIQGQLKAELGLDPIDLSQEDD